ncbi:MAG: c-type cytochrome [Acidobacteria bacterium]|nr:c-type cytochrome [Acidobacteriota bacterium]
MAKKKRKGVFAHDIDRLNMWFAIIAIAAFTSVLWMIWDDYARPWKAYQRQFQVVQNEVTQQQLADEQARVDQQALSQLRQQRDAAEQTLSGQSEQIGGLEDEIAAKQTRLDLADQNFRFSRSVFDTRRWEFEEARKHHGEEGAAAEREALDLADAEVEQYRLELEALTLERDALQTQLSALTDARDAATSEITGMTREIDRLQDRLDGLRFDWVYYLRNGPFMDGLNPSERINQVVLDDIRMDLNFTDAPQVDRCQSCHLGMASADYENYDQPFTSHPRLDLFVADTSIHPAGDFGCSVCHGGKGHATTFYSSVHTPDNESEEERWTHDLGWGEIHLWEWPMRTSGDIEASCVKCHMEDPWLPESPKLEYGLELVENLGCSGCHQIDRFDDDRKRGPDLTRIGAKTGADWAYNWVMDPKSFRPETSMPQFFNLANTSDAYWTGRNQVEAEAIVSYLFASSSDVELDSAPNGDIARGENLVESVGCLGCHMVGDYSPATEYDPNTARFSGYRHHGPDLDGVGSKVSADWLYTWVKDPQHYWAETVMPDLRLTDGEAADITAYLMSLTHDTFAAATMPTVDASLRSDVALEYLQQQMPTQAAADQLAAMDEDATKLYLGERLIARYGCSGCHVVPGFEDAGRIGTSLSEWGSKAVARLDFGLLDLPHDRRTFLEQKLRSPRSYDDGRERNPQELLRMPDFDLTAEEIDAIAVAILGFTDQEMRPAAKPAETPRRLAVLEGQAIADKFNCRGCHLLEDNGGAIRTVIADEMVERGVVNNATAGLAFGPPNLRSQGARVQPAWLYDFFTEPSTVRPWLDVRMPTFPFTDHELNALTAYFAALDEVPYPFESSFTTAHSYPADLVSEGRELAADQSGSLQCFSCHFRGTQEPRVPPSQWAPDLALAASRLRPEWIDGWIKDPQGLQPGTSMPQFYTSLEAGRGFWGPLNNDPQAEIDALVAYIMSLGN